MHHSPTPTVAALLLATLAAVLAPPASSTDVQGPVWLAGDWHVHTSASHDACDPRNATGFVTELDPEEGCGDGPHTISADGATRMREAQARGLDYMRITDHNTLAGQRSAIEGYEGPVVLVPGYEHSLSGGHAGISTLDLLERGRFDSPPPTGPGFNGLIDEVHAAPGGFFVVNHPTDGSGDGWFREGFDWSRPDAFEVWNIHWLWRDDVIPAVADSNNHEALDLWTGLLNAGHRLPVVGASDSHWLATSAAQGPGQPTTWVLADDRTPEALLDGVRGGRTYVAWDLLAPRVSFTASNPEGDTAGIGDTVSGGLIVFEAAVEGSANDRVRFVSCRGVEGEFRVASGLETVGVGLTFDGPCWVRVDVVTVDDELGPEKLLYRAITSPIYVV